MTWLILTLSCIVLWGITDVLYKASSDYDDPLSHYKTFVWIGIVMAMAGGIMAVWSDTLFDSLKKLEDNLYLIPVCLFYAVALLFGLLGKRHLQASVFSSLENIDGAMAAIILGLYFLLTGSDEASDGIGVMTIIATVIIVIGVVLLGIQEHTLSKQQAQPSVDKKNHRLGALALLFPIIYNLADAVTMSEIGFTVSDETEIIIPDNDFFIFECMGFALVAVFVWLYMLIVKKYSYNPFQEEELIRCGAATGETFGTMTFIFATAINPVLTAPIASSYFLITIVLARVFLKERLTKKQYLSLAILVVGIALLGLSEIFGI